MQIDFLGERMNLRLQERDVEMLGMCAQFPNISADMLTRFVMPKAHWENAFIESSDVQERHNATRSVRERMVTLSKADMVMIRTDARSRAAYDVTSKGSAFAELSPRWVGAPIDANSQTLDLLQQADAAADGVGWRYVFRRGCVIERGVIVRADHGSSPLQRADIDRAVHATNAVGLVAVARQRGDAERVRQWGEDIGLRSAVARGEVLPSGLYQVTGLDRPRVQAAIHGD